MHARLSLPPPAWPWTGSTAMVLFALGRGTHGQHPVIGSQRCLRVAAGMFLARQHQIKLIDQSSVAVHASLLGLARQMALHSQPRPRIPASPLAAAKPRPFFSRPDTWSAELVQTTTTTTPLIDDAASAHRRSPVHHGAFFSFCASSPPPPSRSRRTYTPFRPFGHAAQKNPMCMVPGLSYCTCTHST